MATDRQFVSFAEMRQRPLFFALNFVAKRLSESLGSMGVGSAHPGANQGFWRSAREHHCSFRIGAKGIIRLGSGVIGCGAIALMPVPAAAVEQVTVELGPLQATIQVADLQTFSETGAIPPALEPYRALLTPTLRSALHNHLEVEPSIRDRIIADLTDTQTGRPVVDLLAEVAPRVSPETLQSALTTAAETESGLTALTLLQSLPGETLYLEGTELLTLLSQWGLSRLERTALSNILNHELGRAPQQSPSLSNQFEPSMPGRYPVEHWSVSFRDHERDRVIPIDLYWTAQVRGPLVLISHGFGADRHFLSYLAEHLASYGLTVVALEHPGSNVEALLQGEQALLPANEFVERPRDVSFILDRLADLNAHSFFLRDRINLDQVTLIGHSLGGYTGLVLAGGQLDPVALADYCAGLDVGGASPADWLQCAATDVELPAATLADDRITQLVVMNPLAGQIFGEDGLRQVKVPTLFLTGTQDGISSVSSQQLRAFDQLSGPRALIAVIGGTHLSVGDPDNINPALTQVPFMPEHPREETARLRQYLNGTVLSFVMQQTRQAQEYHAFLSPEYAQLFSTPVLPIRYSDRLPQSVSQWLSSSETLNRRLTPLWQSLTSLAHLELIDAQFRIAALRRSAIAQLPIIPLDLSTRLPRSPVLYRTAHLQTTGESSRPAE